MFILKVYHHHRLWARKLLFAVMEWLIKSGNRSSFGNKNDQSDQHYTQALWKRLELHYQYPQPDRSFRRAWASHGKESAYSWVVDEVQTIVLHENWIPCCTSVTYWKFFILASCEITTSLFTKKVQFNFRLWTRTGK